jgi:hypothetical protein
MRRLSYQKAVDALLSNVKRRDDRRYRNFIRAARSFSCGFNGVQHIRVGRVFYVECSVAFRGERRRSSGKALLP